MRPASTSRKVVRPSSSGAATPSGAGLSVGGVGLQCTGTLTQLSSSSPQHHHPTFKSTTTTTTSSPKATRPLSTRPLNVPSKSPSPSSTTMKCHRGGSTSSSVMPSSSSSTLGPKKCQSIEVVDTPKFSAAERGQLVCMGQDTMDAIERRMSEEAMLELRNEKIAARRAAIQAAEATKQAQIASRMRAGAERRARAQASNFL